MAGIAVVQGTNYVIRAHRYTPIMPAPAAQMDNPDVMARANQIRTRHRYSGCTETTTRTALRFEPFDDCSACCRDTGQHEFAGGRSIRQPQAERRWLMRWNTPEHGLKASSRF